jgi:hypothetical protein
MFDREEGVASRLSALGRIQDLAPKPVLLLHLGGAKGLIEPLSRLFVLVSSVDALVLGKRWVIFDSLIGASGSLGGTRCLGYLTQVSPKSTMIQVFTICS